MSTEMQTLDFLAIDTTGNDKDENPSKKKRKANTPVKIGDNTNKNAKTLKRNLNSILKQINLLNTIVKDAYKPKKEYIDISTALDMCARQLQKGGLMEWLERIESDSVGSDQQTKSQCPQNDNKSMSTIGTQVTESDLEEELEISKKATLKRIKDILKEDEGFDCISGVLDEPWPEELFKRTKAQDTDVSVHKTTGDMVIVANPQDLKFDKTMETLTLIHPDLNEMISSNDGEVDFVLNATKTINRNKEESERVRALYLIPWAETSERTKSTRSLYDHVRKLKDAMKVHPTDKIHIMMTEGLKDDGPRKILEYVFQNEEINITLIGRTLGDTNKSKHKFSPEKMIVKCGGTTYADMLRDIRTNVDISRMGVNVKTIRKTAKGDLMLELEGGKGKANVLKEEIIKKINHTDIRVHRQETLIHINDIDAITDIKEKEFYWGSPGLHNSTRESPFARERQSKYLVS
ncbi:unnamed protein product [Phaedon cochleariae]|uniref:Uncharacterized protein n=1 Tax=Phaedon cochleariae TaxID=80249 RepID=A0A9N9SFS3_PHACE|nr:unnamed protein product [Phaedon cochleariae]